MDGRPPTRASACRLHCRSAVRPPHSSPLCCRPHPRLLFRISTLVARGHGVRVHHARGGDTAGHIPIRHHAADQRVRGGVGGEERVRQRAVAAHHHGTVTGTGAGAGTAGWSAGSMWGCKAPVRWWCRWQQPPFWVDHLTLRFHPRPLSDAVAMTAAREHHTEP